MDCTYIQCWFHDSELFLHQGSQVQMGKEIDSTEKLAGFAVLGSYLTGITMSG